MKRANMIEKELFSYYSSDNETEESSLIIFGGFDESFISPNNTGWKTLPLYYESYWSVDISGIQVDGSKITDSPLDVAFIDTGSTHLFFSKEIIK